MSGRERASCPKMRRRDWASSAVIAACLLALVVPYLMPVVILDRADNMRRLPGGSVAAELSAIKIRGCNVVAGSFVGWDYGPKGWAETGFEWVGDLSPDSTKPRSWWRVQLGPALWWHAREDATKVRLTVQHSCGGRAPFVTVLGPYDIPPPPRGE